MPNPTRAQILNAHEALEELKNVALNAADFCGDTEKYLAWKSEIIAALPPKPQPTMAEIAWDDDEHYLAEVENRIWGRGIMLYLDDERDTILCQLQQEGKPFTLQCEPDALTPTGKRYTLTEVQE